LFQSQQQQEATVFWLTVSTPQTVLPVQWIRTKQRRLVLLMLAWLLWLLLVLLLLAWLLWLLVLLLLMVLLLRLLWWADQKLRQQLARASEKKQLRRGLSIRKCNSHRDQSSTAKVEKELVDSDELMASEQELA
jgi:Flp pilus assembly protein TadB